MFIAHTCLLCFITYDNVAHTNETDRYGFKWPYMRLRDSVMLLNPQCLTLYNSFVLHTFFADKLNIFMATNEYK